MSSASSSTTAAAATAGSSTANGATERSGPQVPNGQPAVEDGSGRGSGSGSETGGSNGGGSGNLDQPGGSTSTSTNATTTTGPAAAAAPSGTTAAVVRRKTNVCLICGIYTNLSFNIFEPRNGPNIIDVIYEKYKFRAERGDNADKHICFSCNNWLINWYSLQNTSGSRTYEPTPSTSRSSDSSNNRHSHKRTKHSRTGGGGNDKENARGAGGSSLLRSMLEQHDQVSSTTAPIDDCGTTKDRKDGSTIASIALPYAKRMCRAMAPSASRYNRRVALKENHCQPSPSSNVGTSQVLHRNARMRFGNREADVESVAEVTSTTCEVDPCTMIRKMFEGQLIRMLEGQGTSVTREAIPSKNEVPSNARTNQTTQQSARSRAPRGAIISNPLLGSSGMDANGNVDTPENIDVILSFDSAISEVIDAVPSLKAPQPASGGSSSASCDNEAFLRSLLDNHRQLYEGLTVSVIGGERLQ